MSVIRHRDVFFFPGYDVAGIKRYHRYLKRQCGWYRRRADVEIEVGELTPGDMEGWSVADVSANWPEGRVQTRFHYCNWRDDVARDYAPHFLIRTLRMLKAVLRMAIRGHIGRVTRKGPMFSAALGLPVYLTVLRCVCIAAALLFAAQGGVWIAVGAVFALASLYGLKRLGDALYEPFFMNYLPYLERVLYQEGHGIGGQLEEAIASLTSYGDAPSADHGELLIVGHSYGAVPAIIAADQLTRAGKDVSLLTVGSIAACVALEPDEAIIRPHMEALHRSERICWREYFAPQDSLCFSRLKMRQDFRLKIDGPIIGDIRMLSARFGEVVAQRKLDKFRNNLLRMHFQFLMAVDQPGRYDFHRFTLGPDPLNKAAR